MKKIVSCIVALCLMFTFALPAFALDAEVQAAVDAFEVLENALASDDYNELAKVEDYIGELDALEGALTEEQVDVYFETIGEDRYTDVVVDATYLLLVFEYKDTYKADRNISTAYDFVTVYEALPENMQTALYSDVEFKNALEDAEEDMPAENVQKVYGAFSGMILGLYTFGGDEVESDFVDGVEGFGAELDTLNALTDEEKAELAIMLEKSSGEEAVQYCLDEYEVAGQLLELEKTYLAYNTTPNKDTAAAFVKAYDTITANEKYADEDFIEFINTTYEEMAADYAAASASLVPATTAPAETTTVDKEVIADTADPITMFPIIGLVMSAATIGASKKKRA